MSSVVMETSQWVLSEVFSMRQIFQLSKMVHNVYAACACSDQAIKSQSICKTHCKMCPSSFPTSYQFLHSGISQQEILWLFPPTDRGCTPPCAPCENRMNMQHIEDASGNCTKYVKISLLKSRNYKIHSHIEVFQAVCQLGSLRPSQPCRTTKARNKWDYWAGGGVGFWVGSCFITTLPD